MQILELNPLTKLTLLLGGMVIALAGCAPHVSAVAGSMVCSVPRDPSVVHPGAAVSPGHADLSGGTREGKASFYASSFAHRLMADGQKMDPKGDNAASRTLPLGSTAKVTNVRTGLSAIVYIEDRGPYVGGRILDLSPATARKIGLTPHAGLADVKVAPIAIRLPDGSMKLGSGAPVIPSCRVATS